MQDDIRLIWEPHVDVGVRCNIWHIRGRDRDVLVDSGLGLSPLCSEFSALAEREVLAVCSHTHFDHVGCHHEFSQRLCHPAEADILQNPSNENTVWTAFHDSIDVFVDDGNMLTALPHAGFNLDSYCVRPAPPTQLINEGDELDLGDRLFKVFHMPGHSPGSICLYEEATKILFCGDTLYDGQLLDELYHSDKEAYKESLARLKEIPAETFHCGHYDSFGRQRMLELIAIYDQQKSG